MAVASESPNPQRLLVLVATTIMLVLVTGILFVGRVVLVPVALAVLLSFILAPIVARLQRIGLGRVPAVLVTVVLTGSTVIAIGSSIAYEMKGLAKELPTHIKNIEDRFAPRGEGQGTSLLAEVQDSLGKLVKELLGTDAKAPDAQPVLVRVQTTPLDRLGEFGGTAAGVLASAAFMSVLTVFMLIKREDLRNRVIRLLGRGQLTSTTKALDDAGDRISRFLFMQLTINVAFGTLLSIVLLILQVPFAIVWGFLAGLLRFAPFVGVWLAAALLFTFALATQPIWPNVVVLVVLFLVLELTTANVAEPLLFGHSTGISPVSLLIAAAFWTALWGPIGLVLSTPLTVCLIVLGKYFSGLKFFDVLLGDEPALDEVTHYYQRLLAKDPDEAAELVEQHLKEKPGEGVYDELLLPALVLAKRARFREELSPEDRDELYGEIRDTLDELPASRLTGPEALEAANRPPVLVFGCPVGGKADEVALHMLRRLLAADGCEVEVVSAEVLSSELMARVEREQPVAVCVASLPPAALAHTRYLCKRIRSRFADLKIVVGRWGQTENLEKAQDRLREAGADYVGTTLLETRGHLLPLVQLAAAAQRPRAAAGRPVEAVR